MADKGIHENKEDFLSSFNALSQDEKIELLYSMILSLKQKPSADMIPISVFDNDKLSTFETLVKFMKENLKMRFVAIGDSLNRSDKTIWTTYQKSKQKMPLPFSSAVSDINIPISNFSDRKFTIFESLVDYLKSINMTNHEIAVRLHRDDRTIWSVYDRAKKKKNG